MKKFIFSLIFILTLSIGAYSQTGLGYVNYKLVKTHYGNGNTTQYPNFPRNSADFDKMLDTTNPANTLLGTGEVISDTSQGFAGGNPPGVPGDYYAVEYTGWFYAELGGQYLFYSYSDDSAEIWVNGSFLVGKYNGPGNASAWITLQAGTWYELKYRWQEYGGGAYGYLQVYGPRNGYFYPGGANDVYKVSNQAPVYPHKLDITYNLNSSLNKTKFNSSVILTDLENVSTTKSLSSNGVVNFQEGDGLDVNVYPNGNKKATTVGGNAEWCVIYGMDVINNRYRVGIDKREFPSGFDFTKLTHLQLFDLYDGIAEYKSDDNSWAEYYIPSTTMLDWDGSSYGSYMRIGNGFRALKAEFSFEDITGFTTHTVKLDMDETYFTSTYPDMITIADVAKGFSQLTNQTNTPDGLGGGIFTSDIEFILGDVNDDGAFDFQDSYLLLQHITGNTSPFSTKTIDNSLLMFDGGYTNSLTNNWISKKPATRLFIHALDENNKEKSKSIDVAFMGDLNFSHSSILQSASVSAKSSPILISSKTENVGYLGLDIMNNNNEIEVIIEIPKNDMSITGTQFKVYFDNTKLEYQTSEYSNTLIQNFLSKRENYINIGSFSSDGLKNLNEGAIYKLKFKSSSELNSTLGLVVVGFSELVNKDGTKINWIIQ